MSTDTTLAASSHTPVEREDSANWPTPEQDAFANPLERKLFLDKLNASLFGAERQEAAAIGRYKILRKLGHGGMGVVFLGFDELLDRKAAIKLLRSSHAPPGAQQRLQREAQGLARLSHPNVVQVWDTGTHEGSTYIAMEFIAGQTLGAWLRDDQVERSVEQVLETFVAAGRGLAAAHRVGLIHRDFKPENVMLGEDGQVKVMDFGLARALGDDTRELEAELGQSNLSSSSTPDLTVTLTRTGAVLGTPAYMSPEQFAAQEFDARSDQFSFCVSLWEALYGVRPFAGDNLGQLSAAVRAGEIVPPPADTKVPSAIARALRRGLHPDPDARWESVDALLVELSRDRAGERGRWWTRAAVGLAIAGSLGFAAAGTAGRAEVVDPCPAADEHLEGVWDADTREAARAGLARAGGEYGESISDVVLSSIDDYARSWLDMHEDACEATHVRHEQSATLLDRRMACLDERRVELAAVVGLLTSADEAAVKDSMRLLSGLTSIDPCGDRRYLESQVPLPPDPELAAKITQLRERKAEVQVKSLVDAEGTHAALEQMLAEAEALDYPPLRAELLVALGIVEVQTAPKEQSRARLEQGMIEAVRTGQERVAAKAAAELVYLIGYRFGHAEEGLRLGELSRAWYEHVGSSESGLTRLLLSESLVLGYVDPARAEAGMLEVLARLGVDEQLTGLDALGPSDSFAASIALNGLAVCAYGAGSLRLARERMLRVREVRQRLLSPDHPQRLLMELNLGAADLALGDWEQARAYLEPLLPIYRERVALRPADLRMTLENLAELSLARYELLGEPAREPARAAYAELNAFLDSHEEPEVWSRGVIILANARLALLQGELDQAEATIERAEALLEVQGKEWSKRDSFEVELGLARAQLLAARGHSAAALERLDALELLSKQTKHWPRDHIHEHLRAELLIELGRGDEAAPLLRELLAEWEALNPAGHPYAAHTLKLLARVEPEQAAQHLARADELLARI